MNISRGYSAACRVARRTVAVFGGLCLISGASAQSVVVRDSAGITIVENSQSGATSQAPVRIADRPALQIGLQEGDPNYLFNEIAGATRLSDGSIVVADRGSGQLRIFDGAGRFLRKIGRKGQGPGEFYWLEDVRALRADTLLAFDMLGRFTTFAPKGDSAHRFVVRGGPASETSAVGIVRGTLGDGSMILMSSARQPPPRVRAVVRDTLVVALHMRDGTYVRTIGRFPGIERLLRGGGTGGGYSIAGVPFARNTYLRAGADWLYVAASDDYEILAYDRTGSLKRIIRLRQPAQPVTAALIARHRREPRGRSSPARPTVDPKIDASWYPKVFPPYAGLRVDGAQRLWVQDYPLPGERQPRWKVFAPDGKLLGSVLTPAGVELLEIGTDSLLGLWRDEDGVEHVRVYALSRA